MSPLLSQYIRLSLDFRSNVLRPIPPHSSFHCFPHLPEGLEPQELHKDRVWEDPTQHNYGRGIFPPPRPCAFPPLGLAILPYAHVFRQGIAALVSSLLRLRVNIFRILGGGLAASKWPSNPMLSKYVLNSP